MHDVTTDHGNTASTPGRNTRKRDQDLPRGILRLGRVYGVRFTCGAGHIHQERVGPLKSDAVRIYHERRARALDKPGWCPAVERQHERERARAEQAKEKARVTLRDYAAAYAQWSKANKRSWRTDESRITVLTERFGDRRLDEITPLEIERFRDSLLERVTKATANRYRDLLSAIFKRAVRDGHVSTNPVRTVSKFKEPGGRTVYLTSEEEAVIREALPAELRPLFAVSVHTGLRWSEQTGLRWQDVDILSGFITVARSKHGRARTVPMNSVVRSVLLDLATQRERPDDPDEPVFWCRYREPDKFFPRAVGKAQTALKDAGKDTSRLDGYTWHGNRHTFASRLVMAGVDPRTVQELGGWRTLTMVQRYAHLAPAHLQAAVERLVNAEPVAAAVRTGMSQVPGAVELGRNLNGGASASGVVS